MKTVFVIAALGALLAVTVILVAVEPEPRLGTRVGGR